MLELFMLPWSSYLAPAFMPHGMCYLWKPELVWLHVVSDSVTALAYYSIPIMLVYFIRERSDVPFRGIFWLFGAFIAACGTSHLTEVWTIWHPDYWLSVGIKAIVAVVSAYTALEMYPLIPKALSLPSPGQLQEANEKLASEIEERQRTQEALQVVAHKAEVANRAKSQFLSQMSHELRTPLNAILGFTQLMNRDEALSIEHKEHLRIITRSGEHLLSLINDILSMSKIEAGQERCNENSFDLYQLLDGLQEMLAIKAASKDLELLFDIAADVPQYIKTDENKLRQVLINLVGNAIKFTESGKVNLRVAVGKGQWCMADGQETAIANEQFALNFEISDTGPGIAPAEMDSLFEAFVRTKTGENFTEGTGLGLPISQTFVQLMGGNIAVSSTLGKGSIFKFDIQIGLASSTEVETTEPLKRAIALAPNQPRHRILVVEDRRENRQLLVKLLSSVGLEVRSAVNGKEAIAVWESWKPHLIWMDMQMPVMDGYEATRQIKARQQQYHSRVCFPNSRTVQQPLAPPHRTLLGAPGKSQAPLWSLDAGNEATVPGFAVFAEGESPEIEGSSEGHPTIIIALTANAFEEEREQILSAGCDDLVYKPFLNEILFEKMAKHLGVHYIYEENDEIKTIQNHQNMPLQTTSSNQGTLNSHNSQKSSERHAGCQFQTGLESSFPMPSAWLAQLQQAALCADDELILSLIEQIPESNAPMARRLTQWVNEFRFDKIIDLTQQAVE